MRGFRPAALVLLGLFTGISEASSLRVAPVNVQVTAPATTSLLRVANSGGLPIVAQLRVFRWSQKDGEEVLTPTTDVVVSPPAANIEPGKEQVVRLVRTLESPVVGEESYRILVDELPTSQTGPLNGPTLRVLIRYSIPVFFNYGLVTEPELVWSAHRSINDADNAIILVARNPADTHVKMTNLRIDSDSLHFAPAGGGLAGYVLPGHEKRWQVDMTAEEFKSLPQSLSVTVDVGAKTYTDRVNLEGAE